MILTESIKFYNYGNYERRQTARTMQSSDIVSTKNSVFSIEVVGSILKKINPEDVKIHPTLFKEPLYINTVLERQNFQTPAVVLRKNIYFLAKKTVNVFDFIIQLVQVGLLHLDDRKRIMTLEDELTRVLECYIIVAQKSNSKYEKLLQVFRMTKNVEILGLLESHQLKMMKISAGSINPTMQTPQCVASVSKSPDAMKIEDWSCTRCTFLNKKECETCGICNSSKNMDPKDVKGSNQCPQCTLLNYPEVTMCEACGFVLKDEAAVANLDEESPPPLPIFEEEHDWE